MKKIIVVLFILCVLQPMYGQQQKGSLTIEQCYESARQNYPLIKQRELIEKSEQYSISNATKGIFPVITINGQESYQSDVTEVPIQLPEMNIDKISKHQYKIYGEAVANIYDGGLVRNQKQSIRETAKIEEQKLEVELYKLKDRINQLYFGILMIDAQIDQNELLKADIGRGIKKTEAAIQDGVALKSSADALHAELLKADQRTIELKANRKAYLEMLGLMTGESLEESTVLQKPQPLVATSEINRPELRMFEYQRKAIDVQDKMITTKNLPKFSAFVQGGYGRPALNMLNSSADTYYVAGLRLNWTISNFYTSKKERALLDITRKNIDLQKETFLYNTNLTLKNQHGELNKLQEVLKSDDDIIQLRERIKNTASAQLENGVINSNDYLREVTAEDQARQNKILHEIQLLLAQYSFQTTAGI
jgi:outer membrane protein TolC